MAADGGTRCFLMAYSPTQKLLLLIATPTGMAIGATLELLQRARVAGRIAASAQKAIALKMLNVCRSTPSLPNTRLDFSTRGPGKIATQRMTRQEFAIWLQQNPPTKSAAMPRPASITYFSPTERRTQRTNHHRNGGRHGRSA